MSIATSLANMLTALTNFGNAKLKVKGGVLASYREKLVAQAVNATPATQVIDCSASNNYALTLGANGLTLSMSNVPTDPNSVFNLTLELIYGVASPTFTFAPTINWEDGIVPQWTGTLNRKDIVVLVKKQGVANWDGYVSGKNRPA